MFYLIRAVWSCLCLWTVPSLCTSSCSCTSWCGTPKASCHHHLSNKDRSLQREVWTNSTYIHSYRQITYCLHVIDKNAFWVQFYFDISHTHMSYRHYVRLIIYVKRSIPSAHDTTMDATAMYESLSKCVRSVVYCRQLIHKHPGRPLVGSYCRTVVVYYCRSVVLS